jgi:hypothetical protein
LYLANAVGGGPVNLVSLDGMTLRDNERRGLKQIVDDLSAYLEQSPKAADTLEGIAQ